MNIPELFGILGLVLIILGVVMHKRRLQDEYYIAGGLSLLVYSAWLGNWIFITLQAVFVLVAGYDLMRKKKK